MMIKALILTHLWSLLIASGAWALQRDKGRQLGTYFPTPKVWLGLILLCFLPGAISLLPVSPPMKLPAIEIFKAPAQASSHEQSENAWSINYLALYFVLGVLLASRTFFRWARLQFISLSPTSEPDIFITSSDLPPLTLSWPLRAVVVPDGLQNQAALIRHERAHLRHHDGEVTLCLLIMRDLMLRNFGLSYLVRQWRLAIELRADHAATEMLSTSERKDYAALLLNGLRSGGVHAGGRTLPCPTAHLTSTRHRSVKMRLTEIMDNKSKPRKRRWSGALLITAIGAGALGILSTNAIADEDGLNNIQYSDITYLIRVPPKMPDSCPGLNLDDIKIIGKEMKLISGETAQQHTMTVGSVVLKYNAQLDGSIGNIRVVKSNHPCFEPNAKAAVAQWKAEPQKEVNDVSVRIEFMVTGETHEDLEPTLNRLLK